MSSELKPIEEGCLAMIIKSCCGNEGKVITVGKYIGEIPFWVGNNRWQITPPIMSNVGGEAYTCDESCLLRIDDDTLTSELTEKELELIGESN